MNPVMTGRAEGSEESIPYRELSFFYLFVYFQELIMEKKNIDIVKAFAPTVEEACAKLRKKYVGFQMSHPAYKDVAMEDLEFDCDSYSKEGEEWWWAKIFTTVVPATNKVSNKPEVKPTKSRKKKVA